MDNCMNGAPGRIRTHDPQIRSLVLYPAELPVLYGAAEPRQVGSAWQAPQRQRRKARSRSAFRITLTDENVIAAAAIMGDGSTPKTG